MLFKHLARRRGKEQAGPRPSDRGVPETLRRGTFPQRPIRARRREERVLFFEGSYYYKILGLIGLCQSSVHDQCGRFMVESTILRLVQFQPLASYASAGKFLDIVVDPNMRSGQICILVCIIFVKLPRL